MSAQQNSTFGNTGTIAPPLESAVDLLEADEIVETLIGSVLVDSPVIYASAGAVERKHVTAIWKWLIRDIDAGLNEQAVVALSPNSAPEVRAAFSQKIAELIARTLKVASANDETERRLRVQIGGDEVYKRLEIIQNAFRYQPLLPQAVAFGRAIDGVRDENALKLALNAFPVNDPAVSALMMHAAIGQIKNPHRLISVVLDLAGSETEIGVERAGFAPVAEALIAHAQNQLSVFTNSYGQFADIDLACRALDRFHRLIRAIGNITECDKSSPWAKKVAGLIREISQMIEPRLARVDSDIRVSLRKPRTGPDQLDPELTLDALNGMYLLAAVREARESLALNSLVSTVWVGTGKDLEVLIGRNLEACRRNPDNEVITNRLNAGIKLAEVRFNQEYAEILKRARDGAGRLSE